MIAHDDVVARVRHEMRLQDNTRAVRRSIAVAVVVWAACMAVLFVNAGLLP